MVVETLSYISQLAERYEAFFLSIGGVLYDGAKISPQAIECLQKLSENKKNVVFLTNTPERSQHVIEELKKWGVPPALFQHVISAGEDLYKHLESRRDPFYGGLGDTYYFIGPTHSSLLDGLQLHRTGHIDEADFIIVAGQDDWHSDIKDYEKCLKIGVEHNIPMICANPDQIGLCSEGGRIEAGNIAHIYQGLGGRVRYHGKPEKIFFRQALRKFTVIKPEQVLVIGDGLQTDIKGAVGVGLDCAYIPRNCGMSIKEVDSVYKTAGIMPTYTLTDFRWAK